MSAPAIPDGDEHIDDPELGDDLRVLRRIRPSEVVKEQDRPSSSNFYNDKEGKGTSVDLWEPDRRPDDVLKGHDGYGVVSISIGEIRRIGKTKGHPLGVIRVPQHNNRHHAHIQGRKTGSIRSALANAARWEIRPAEVNG